MGLFYIIKEGYSGLKRAKLSASTSIFSLFLALLLLGSLTRVFYSAYTRALAFNDLVEIEVFLFDVDGETTAELENRLTQESLIKRVQYISKDSAAAIMRAQIGEESTGLIDLKFLPASFKLQVDMQEGVEQIETLISRIQNLRGVDEVEYNPTLMRMMEANLQTFTLFGGALGFLILIAALALVYNTIRLTIYAKRELIRAMKLVGATNGFIRTPFIIEGMLQGLISSGIAVFTIFALFEFVIPAYVPQIGILEWPFGRWYFLTGGIFTLGLMMGWWGSFAAARKFIKETLIAHS